MSVKYWNLVLGPSFSVSEPIRLTKTRRCSTADRVSNGRPTDDASPRLMAERTVVRVGCWDRYGTGSSQSHDISARARTCARTVQLLCAAARTETVVLTRYSGGRRTRFDSCRDVIIFIRATVIDHVVVFAARRRRRVIIE